MCNFSSVDYREELISKILSTVFIAWDFHSNINHTQRSRQLTDSHKRKLKHKKPEFITRAFLVHSETEVFIICTGKEDCRMERRFLKSYMNVYELVRTSRWGGTPTPAPSIENGIELRAEGLTSIECHNQTEITSMEERATAVMARHDLFQTHVTSCRI
jgi:hypothetical protein